MATVETTATERLLTAEAYRLLPDNGMHTELVRGRIVIMNPPTPWHGYVCGRVIYLISAFLAQHDLGYVMGNDSGVLTERDPDTLRGADISFYSYDRLPKGGLKDGYLAVTPDLIIEVRSSNDRWKEILVKVVEYLKAGVSVVCVLDPERRQAFLFDADQPMVTPSAEQDLSFPTILPGFSERVEHFFE